MNLRDMKIVFSPVLPAKDKINWEVLFYLSVDCHAFSFPKLQQNVV